MSYRFEIRNLLTYLSLQVKQKSSIKNPFSAYGFGKPLTLMSGEKLEIPREYRYLLKAILDLANNHMVQFKTVKESSQEWELDFKKSIFTVPQGIHFSLDSMDSTIFSETFVYDIHFAGFDLRDKIIIDAGGFVGDTALYYASKGATVYTFEPDPINYTKLIRNLKLNNSLARLIHPFNMALGINGSVEFPIGNGGKGSVYSNSLLTVKVPSISLEEILNQNNITDPYLLHLDVKGAEHNLLQDQVIEKFQRLRIEYSPYMNGKDSEIFDYPSWIEDQLKSRNFSIIRVFKHNNIKKALNIHGTIDATKENN